MVRKRVEVSIHEEDGRTVLTGYLVEAVLKTVYPPMPLPEVIHDPWKPGERTLELKMTVESWEEG